MFNLIYGVECDQHVSRVFWYFEHMNSYNVYQSEVVLLWCFTKYFHTDSV